MQVYDIPIGFMNKTVAEGICSGIGEVCPSEFSIMEGGDHVCVHVILDISKVGFLLSMKGCQVYVFGVVI